MLAALLLLVGRIADIVGPRLAAQPHTQFIADAAREAMTHSVTLVGYTAAAVIILLRVVLAVVAWAGWVWVG